MWYTIFICLICSMVQFGAGDMLGPGIWSLISLSDCPDEIPDAVLTVETNKHKLNRTHDGINAKVECRETIDESFALLIEVCKYVDGGCKQYQVVSDESMVNMLYRYAKENAINALVAANIDPPEFPVNEGKYEIEDYIMDWCGLPRDAIYGKFEALSYLLKDDKKVFCIKAIVEFNKFEDGNYCDEE